LRSTTDAWAATAGFVPAGRYGNFWVYTLNYCKPAK
jgi:hypothetical protein